MARQVGGPHPTMRFYYVYILANRKNGTLYIGVTNDLIRRIDEHRQGIVPGFTKRYGIKRLVYYECTNNISAAIWREKCLKWWQRRWKIELIESMNPTWRDLWEDIKYG